MAGSAALAQSTQAVGSSTLTVAPKSMIAAKLAGLGTTPKIVALVSALSAVGAPVAVQIFSPDTPRETRAGGQSENRTERPPSGQVPTVRNLDAAEVVATPNLNVETLSEEPSAARRRQAPLLRTRDTPLAPPTSLGQLSAETKLMEQALGALRNGDHQTARIMLQEHEQRFPHGVLEPERRQTLERINAE
jgi:hypothetical protein